MAFNYQGFATLGVNLNRQKYGPLDISSVFATQADLNYYLTKGAVTEGVSTYWYESAEKKVVPYPYAGQLIATAFAGEDVKVWVLSEKEDGTFETKNVGDTSAVETDLSELQAAIDNINTIIGTEATGDNAATGFYKAFADLQTAVKANTDAIGVKAQPESTEGAGDAVPATGIYKLIEEATYDDTALEARIKSIEDDHLNSDDQAAIDKAIADAAKAAEDAAVKRILTDGSAEDEINDAYDTIKEIADWIASGTTTDEGSSVDLIGRVAAIESDYLTASDKYDDTAITGRLDTVESALEDLTIKSANDTDFTVTDGVLTLNKIAQDKVDGLPDALTDYENRIAEIEKDYLTSADKYDDTAVLARLDGIDTAINDRTIKSANTSDFTVTDGVLAIAEGKNLISDDDALKLSKLILNDDGTVTTGQKVAAGDVEGLAGWLTDNRDKVTGLFSSEAADTLATALQGITVNGVTVTPGEGRIIDLPVATAGTLGLVKGSDTTNKVAITEDGTMEINSVSVSKLTQAEDEELILFGGDAKNIKSTDVE